MVWLHLRVFVVPLGRNYCLFDFKVGGFFGVHNVLLELGISLLIIDIH
jgi:hypothetical protein